MKKIRKNQKGFTLAEEVITVLLISILIAAAGGILINAMRIFSQNVMTLTAQEKGIAVMDQLEENLVYAKQLDQVADANTFFEDTDVRNEPYQMNLDISGDYVVIHSRAVFSSVDEDTNSNQVENKVCKLGNYEIAYTLEKSAGDDDIVIYLQVKRYDHVYYSERRTVVLKNDPTSEAFSYDSSSGRYLHIGSIE